jgi:spore coat polysaccharide biosynthesis protein SpsF
MTLLGVIQARTSSTRLPNKSLTPLAGVPAVEWLYRRATSVRHLDRVVLAVPTGDDPLIEWAGGVGAPVVQGPEHDVLARFCEVARRFDADALVRMTADCPLLDPALVEDLADRHGARGGLAYSFVSGYPRGCGDAEIITTSALHRAAREATEEAHREHVVTYVAERPDEFEVAIESAPAARHRPDLRVCIDERADLDAVTAVIDALGIDARAPDVDAVIRLLDSRPDIVAMNADVRQRS